MQWPFGGMIALAIATVVAGAAHAQNGGSVNGVDFLSPSVERSSPPPPRAVRRFDSTSVEIQPLPSLEPDALGLLPSRATGFPTALWGPATPETVIRLLARVENTGVPAARKLYHRLLLAEALPPAGSNGQVLLARIDRLLSLGALDEAEAMLARAPQLDADAAARVFDIGLLSGRVNEPCELFTTTPGLTPDYSIRIYCAARDGDWATAALTLTIGETLGLIEPLRAQHLTWYLDPEAYDSGTVLPRPDPLTPLDFVLREATGQPRSPQELPLSFLTSDLVGTRSLRSRIEAAERMVMRADLPAPVLFAAYREGRPAASGGLWGRAWAVQDLDEALETDTDILAAVHAADFAFAPLGLRAALANEYADQLLELPPSEPDPTMASWLLLADRPAAARDWMAPTPGLQDTVALAVLSGIRAELQLPLPQSDGDQRAIAIYEAFRYSAPEPTELTLQIDAGAPGVALLMALSSLDAGVGIESDDLRNTLAALIYAEQQRLARDIAVQTLFLMP